MQRGNRWRYVVGPFAAGLGVLAMIGTGEGRVDVSAHLYGLHAGRVLGAAATRALARPRGRWSQLGIAAASIAIVLGSWQFALG